jgi:DNA helicase-2/ATP-dependent DNA helicase PcrA
VFVDDLFSGAAVRARDVESIQVPEVAAPQPVASRVAFSETAPCAGAQAALFSEAARPDSVYPNLAGWTSLPPVAATDGKLQLSATAIDSYRDCPLKFKLSHYLRIPTAPQPALTFGNIMHQCVRYYFQLRKRSEPSFPEMEAFFLRAWKDAGFEDAYQEQAYKKAGLEQLREFVERQKGSTIAAETIRMEESFRLDLGDVVLEGRIDQVNPLGPPAERTVELIDYKTGRPRSQKDTDRSLQLSIYALAAREQLKLRPARLSFYNLTNNQSVSTVRTDRDLDQALAEIREVAEQIRQLRFPPTPGFVCKYCDYVPVCPAHEEIY